MKLCHNLLALALLALTASAHAQSYTVTDLGALLGTSNSLFGAALNNAGQVTGSYYSPTAGGVYSILTGPAGASPIKSLNPNSSARAVNSLGQVAGQFNSHAFLSGVQGNGPLKDLGALNNGNYSFALGVNTRGQVVGTSWLYGDYSGNNTSHAFLSGPNGTRPLKDLGTLGGRYSYGVGVNDSGQVAGASDTAAESASGYTLTHAFLSGPNGGTLTDLGTLGGNYSEGHKVNAHGQVTGYADTATGTHAFLSGPNGARPLKDLGALANDSSTGDDVNTAGVVVGASSYPGSTGQYDTHAFVYASGVMTDLNNFVDLTSGIVLTEATAISDTGYIVASGTINGQSDTFLLTPSVLAIPVNLGPKIVVSAVASAVTDSSGTRSIAVTVTNNGATYADQLRITGISVNGATPPSGYIQNVLPTIPNLLTPGVSETDNVIYQTGTGLTRAVVTVGGDYIDPTTGGTGHFSGSVRIALP